MNHVCMRMCDTGWRRLIGSPKLQIIFHKRATKYRSLLRKMTYKDKGSYESSPPCTHTWYFDVSRTCSRMCLCHCLVHTWIMLVCGCVIHIHDSSTRSVTWMKWCHMRIICHELLVCVAVCCSVLQCVAVCCSVLQCVAVCRSVLHWVLPWQMIFMCCIESSQKNRGEHTNAFVCVCICHQLLSCNTLQHTATHYNTLQHTTTHFKRLQHTAAPSRSATHCNTLHHTATHCNTY